MGKEGKFQAKFISYQGELEMLKILTCTERKDFNLNHQYL